MKDLNEYIKESLIINESRCWRGDCLKKFEKCAEEINMPKHIAFLFSHAVSYGAIEIDDKLYGIDEENIYSVFNEWTREELDKLIEILDENAKLDFKYSHGARESAFKYRMAKDWKKAGLKDPESIGIDDDDIDKAAEETYAKAKKTANQKVGSKFLQKEMWRGIEGVLRMGIVNGYIPSIVMGDKNDIKYGISKENIRKVQLDDGIDPAMIEKIISKLEKEEKYKFEKDEEWQKAGYTDPNKD